MQNKGGVGKSMLTYLLALKHQKDSNEGIENLDKILFADGDILNLTTDRQCKFLTIAHVNLMDKNQKFQRDKLLRSLEYFSKVEADIIYIDFGASESGQFPALVSLDYSSDLFQDFAQNFEIEIIVNVVVAGGTSFIPCTDFLKNVVLALNRKITVCVWANDWTFKNDTPESLAELSIYCQKEGLAMNRFGNFDTDSSVGSEILNKIKFGCGFNDYDFIHKMTLRKELDRL
ncbi:MAG: hypothetical protein MUF58_10010 [Arcicella sp.]|nr:hypothetical protein [Arcicella sp.]